MNELSRFKRYEDFKIELDTEIKKEAEGFVKIGYLLRLAKDTDILEGSQYSTIEELAKAEYGIDKSQVSRFIAINERFSEDGYSDTLKVQYEGFGVAKLGIMLQLPDELNEELTPDFTKAEINTLREEVKEEAKVTDVEVMMEVPEPSERTMFTDAISAAIEAEPLLMKAIVMAKTLVDLQDAWAPSGESIKTVRLAGVGRLMLILKENEVQLFNVRSNEKEIHSWEEFETECRVISGDEPTAEAAWREWFQYEMPQPVVQEAPKTFNTVENKPKEAPKVTKAEPKKPEPKKEPEKTVNTEENQRISEVETEEIQPKLEDFGIKEPEKVEIEPVATTNGCNTEENQEISEVAPVQQDEKMAIFNAKCKETFEFMDSNVYGISLSALQNGFAKQSELEGILRATRMYEDMIRELIEMEKEARK